MSIFTSFLFVLILFGKCSPNLHQAFNIVEGTHSCSELQIVAEKGLENLNFNVPFISITGYENFVWSAMEDIESDCILILTNSTNSAELTEKVTDSLYELSKLWVKTSKPIVFMLFDDYNKNLPDFLKALRSALYFGLSSNIYILHELTVYEVYFVKRTQIFKMVPWNESYCHGLDKNVERRSDFHQTQITFVTKTTHSDYLTLEWIDRKLKIVGGSTSYWFLDLQLMLNMSMYIVTGGPIKLRPDGSPTGKMFQHLETGWANVPMDTVLLPTTAWPEYLTFLQPISHFHVFAFFQQPASNSIRNIVTTPFKVPVWIFLFLTWILLIIFLRLLFYIQNKFTRTENKTDAKFLSELNLWAVAVNCQKSMGISPQTIYLKIIFLVGYFSGILIFTAYSAMIITSISVSIIPVKQFKDLLANNFQLTTHLASKPLRDILQHLIEKHQLNQKVLTIETEEQITHLLQNPKAFLGYEDLFYRTARNQLYNETFVCQMITKVRLSDFRYKSALMTPRGSQYNEFLNHKLMKILQTGLALKYMQMYQRQTVYACGTGNLKQRRKLHPDPITGLDVITPFLVIITGVIASTTVLIYERLNNAIVSD